MNDEIRKWIADEVGRKMATLTASIEGSVEAQNRILAIQAQRTATLEETLRALYRNGSSGPPGFIEMAHAQNSEKLEKLAESVDNIRSWMERELGKVELQERQKQDSIAQRKLDDDFRTSRVERWKHYAGMLAIAASAFGGAWAGPIIKPIIKVLLNKMVQ